MSYEDVCAIAWKGYKAGKGAGKKGLSGSGTWHRGTGADQWTSGRRDDGGKKGSKCSKPDWHSDKDQGGTRSKGNGQGKGNGKGKSGTRYSFDCGQQGHIGMNCPYKWTNSIDEEDDEGSSWESEPEGEKADELASLETPDDEREWCWPGRNRITRWRRRVDPRPAFHYLAEDDEDEQASGGLNHLASRNAGGTPRTWKKVTTAVDSGAAENVMPRSMFLGISTEETERSKNGKGFKGPGGEHIKKYGQQVIVRQKPGRIRTQEHVAFGRREKRPLVSASHIQAGNDLFIGTDVAYIMNRKKKEKSVLRTEGNVHVLDLFVKVLSGAVAPIQYKAMEVDAINQVADGREQRKRVTFDCNNPTF